MTTLICFLAVEVFCSVLFFQVSTDIIYTGVSIGRLHLVEHDDLEWVPITFAGGIKP